MFPWSNEFVWDAYHVAFFAAFYGVLATIAGVLGLSALRAMRDARAGRGGALAWQAGFEELPRRDRACRHQLTGEVAARVCENGFDCRSCATHPSFMARRAQAPLPQAKDADVCGLELPLDRLYHRGHSFVKPEADGTLSVGLDALARRLLGAPERLELPAAGTRLGVGTPALRLRSRGSDVRVLSPVEGVVLGSSGEGLDVTLRVDPGPSPALDHLLAGPEVRPWALRELERLQAALGAKDAGAALADGGSLVEDLGSTIPAPQLDAVLGEMFLDL